MASNDDKKGTDDCDDVKSPLHSKATVISSDDESNDDFASLTGSLRGYFSNRQHDVSALGNKKSPVAEAASVNGTNVDEHGRISFFSATSPQSAFTFRSPHSAANSQLPASLAAASLHQSTANTQTTGILS